MRNILYLFTFFSLAANPFLASGQGKPNYTPQYAVSNGGIVGYNTGRYNNRPLYINNTNAFVLTGDQPIARLVKGSFLYGTFMLALQRDGKSTWLHHCSKVTSVYGAGKMAWEIADIAFPGLKVFLEVLPMANATGMAVSASAEGMKAGDKLTWAFGSAQWRVNQNLSWKLDVMGQPELLTWGFVPAECKNNVAEINHEYFSLHLLDTASGGKKLFTVAGKCSAPTTARIGAATEWSNAATFTQSVANDLPLLNGTVALEKGKIIYWAFEAFNQPATPVPEGIARPEKTFADGNKRINSFNQRLKISTPDPYLNAIAGASVAAVDGTWYPPVFVHGALQWNNRFPGWRTIFGGTMYGWHNRVRDEAKFYTDSQVKTADKKEAKADPATLLTEQHPDSRFYGLGHIEKDQSFYNMQTQFFDQVVEEYRWTNDPDLIRFFRQALELHLVWAKDCFDPDGDGVYESYINTWPTDSQWYNGGGSAEETSYAYRGHLAARDMARNAGDAKAEQYHVQMLEKIKTGFFKKMWISKKGHSGSYVEQGGHQRLHEDPWLYSIFLPVDAGLTSPLQSIESVYYSEWALQNDRVTAGGRKVWTSNWLPAIWSVRELWPGDNYHLALSYFKAGLPVDGWDIMRGTFMSGAFDHISPGNLGAMQGGIDFGDCVHTFSRALVAGLFGYSPDYPNNKVTISPQFPGDWNQASIELPDVKIAFNKMDNKINYVVGLHRAANVELLLPVQATGVKSVMVNGKKVKWKLLPAVGRSMVQIQLNQISNATIVIETEKSLPFFAPATVEGNVHEAIQLDTKNARIIEVSDPQNVLDNEKASNGMVTAKITGNKGFHTVVATVMAGNAPQWRVFRIKVNDPVGQVLQDNRFVDKVPANASWESIAINSFFNADITGIYKHQYLSPRPNTVSSRLGTDGYSPWTFPHWKSVPPPIKTDQVSSLLNSNGQLVTKQGVPFAWNNGTRNIAFTSMWDNFPSRIDIPVNQKGTAVYFLVAGSTNVMQCQIANAVIRLIYADGYTDSLELIPPVNYWNLSTIDSHASAPGQGSRTDYTSPIDQFCMPAKYPETVRLGENCRAMLLNLKMRKGVELKSVILETLSQEVVVGLMGITIMK